MSKISSYVVDSNVTLGDKVIGTDIDNMNVTKNFTLESIIDLGVSEGITAPQSQVDDLQVQINGLASYYGSFYDTTTQTAGAINHEYAMKLNSVDSSSTSGFSVVNDGLGAPTIIKAAHAGVYNIAFSAQLQRTSGGSSETVDIWLKRDNANVAYTNTSVNVQANAGYLVAAWNFFVQMDAGTEIQLMWATTSTAIQIAAAVASGLHPATPSVILTVNKVS